MTTMRWLPSGNCSLSRARPPGDHPDGAPRRKVDAACRLTTRSKLPCGDELILMEPDRTGHAKLRLRPLRTTRYSAGGAGLREHGTSPCLPDQLHQLAGPLITRRWVTVRVAHRDRERRATTPLPAIQRAEQPTQRLVNRVALLQTNPVVLRCPVRHAQLRAHTPTLTLGSSTTIRCGRRGPPLRDGDRASHRLFETAGCRARDPAPHPHHCRDHRRGRIRLDTVGLHVAAVRQP